MQKDIKYNSRMIHIIKIMKENNITVEQLIEKSCPKIVLENKKC